MNIIISGATKGLGEALVSAFLARGDKVFGFSRNQANIDEALDRLSKEFPEALQEKKLRLVTGDIANPTTTRDIVENAYEWLGGIDMVINNVGIFKFDRQMSELAPEDCSLSTTPDTLRTKFGNAEDFEKKSLYCSLMQTNLYGNARFIEMVISRATKDGHPLIVADVGSIGAIDQLSAKKFDGTVFYNRSKAQLVAHTIELVDKNPLLLLRVVHPGPFGESAQAIAYEYGDTWAIKNVADVASHAVKLFTEDTQEKITHGIIASEKHFCWHTEFFGDIEALGIRGLTWKRTHKVPEGESTHLVSKK